LAGTLFAALPVHHVPGAGRGAEEEMAGRIDQSWDRTLDLTLEENGIRT
jgi:hypothetical protein